MDVVVVAVPCKHQSWKLCRECAVEKSLDKTVLKDVIANAIKSYADAELTDLRHRDVTMRETAFDAMEKLIGEASKIAGYALLGLERDRTHNP